MAFVKVLAWEFFLGDEHNMSKKIKPRRRKLNKKYQAQVAEIEKHLEELKTASQTIKDDPSVETVEQIVKLVSTLCGLSSNLFPPKIK